MMPGDAFIVHPLQDGEAFVETEEHIPNRSDAMPYSATQTNARGIPSLSRMLQRLGAMKSTVDVDASVITE